jgi:dual specificity protein kinase YAK1
MGQPAQFNSGLASHPQQLGTKYGQPPAQTQPPVGYTYETFQTPGTSSKAPSAHPNSKPVSMASSPTATPRSRDYVTDADTTMEDADPYNRAKYPSRPTHHSRASSQFLNQAEESSAARRYSPMNVLSPPMSYPASPGKPQGSYGSSPSVPGQTRRSPARGADYASPPQGYQSPPCKRLLLPMRPRSGQSVLLDLTNAPACPLTANRPPRLPPLQAADLSPDQYYPPSASSHMSPTYGPGSRSPRSGSMPSQVPGRGPVPKFQKIKTVQELQPRVHAQPAYRRANPEGGFISVRVF